MTTPNYRYLLHNLTAPYSIVGELAFTSVTWSSVLNDVGEFTGAININDPRAFTNVGTYSTGYVSTLEYITQPGRVGLFVEYNGVGVWGGIVWMRTWDSSEQLLTIGAKTFESWFERRVVKDYNQNTGVLYFDTTVDQFQVMAGVNGILDNVDTATFVMKNGSILSGNIGITYDTSINSGVLLPQQYQVADSEHKTVMQVLGDLYQQSTSVDPVTGVAVQAGFDFGIDVYYDAAGNMQRTYRQYYPRKGVSDTTSSTLPMLEFPGTALSYSWQEDGSGMATSVHGIGAGVGDGVYTVEQTADVGYISLNYPLLEQVESFTQVPAPNIVDALTQAKANALATPVVTAQFVWSPGWRMTADLSQELTTGPTIGSFAVGDTFRIRILDPRFPTGSEFFLRLTKFEVKVGDDGSPQLVTGDFAALTY